jgi:hypothetical protein
LSVSMPHAGRKLNGLWAQSQGPFSFSFHGRSNLRGISLMTNQSGGEPTEQKTAAERIEEARQLNRNINQTLKTIIELFQEGDFDNVALLPKQMALLNTVVTESQKRETEFNDRHGTGLAEGDIDFDDLRREIGCRLGRIRRCCKS